MAALLTLYTGLAGELRPMLNESFGSPACGNCTKIQYKILENSIMSKWLTFAKLVTPSNFAALHNGFNKLGSGAFWSSNT